MKLIHIFTKTPNHKKFNYVPRHYDPLEEERLERERRIQLELRESKQTKENDTIVSEDEFSHRTRIAGSFKKAKKTVVVQKDPSASMVRLVILLIVSVGLIAYLEFGNVALYGTAFVFVPFYFYLKFRNIKQREQD